MQNETLEKVNNRLNHRVEKIEQSIAVVTKLIPEKSLNDDSMIKKTNSTSSISNIFSTGDKIRDFNGILNFEKKVTNNLIVMHGKIDNLYTVVKQDSRRLGIGYSEDFRNVALKDQVLNENAVGGPFEPYKDPLYISSNKSSEMIKRIDIDFSLQKKVAYIKDIMDIIRSAPLDKPGKNVTISGHYGPRFDPFSGQRSMHHGVDLVISDRRIQTPKDGVVKLVNTNSPTFGKFIIIEHPMFDKDGKKILNKSFTTKYGHLCDVVVKEGDIVNKGQVIGIQGSTGRSSGDHLHLEIAMNNKNKTTEFNPIKLLTFKDNNY